MNILPWRVKNFVSEHFPLLYHLAVNAGLKSHDSAYWDQRLGETWDERNWPTKCELIADLTRPEVPAAVDHLYRLCRGAVLGTGPDLLDRRVQHLHAHRTVCPAIQNMVSLPADF